MFPSNPGPNSTVSGLPVSATGSPGRMPEVSSYTWTTVFSPRIWMTSPVSGSGPTSMTSYMRGFTRMAVTTGPATRWIVPVPLISVVTFALAATLPTSLEQIHADRSLHLRPQVFVLRRADRDHDRPRDGLEPPPHRVAQTLHVRGIQDQDAHLGVVEDRGDLLLDLLPRARDGASHADQLEALNEVVPAHCRDLHLTPPRAPGSRRSRAGFLSRGRSAGCSGPRGLCGGCSRGSGGWTRRGDASTARPRSGGSSPLSGAGRRPRSPRRARGRPRSPGKRNTRSGGP